MFALSACLTAGRNPTPPPGPGEWSAPRTREDKTWAVLVKKEPVSHQTFIKSALEAANLAEKKKASLQSQGPPGQRVVMSLTNHGVLQTVVSAVIL